MIDSLILYFNTFRELSSENKEETELSYVELLGISWALHMLHAFYSLFAVFLGVKSYTYFAGSKDFSYLVLDSFHFQFEKIGLISTLFAVVFYPFVFQFSHKFWSGSFKFYANIFDFEDEQFEKKSQDILAKAYTSNLFLVLPVVGSLFSQIAFGFFLFQGLKKKYDFSSLQVSLILITPLFITFLFAIFSASYFLFLISLI